MEIPQEVAMQLRETFARSHMIMAELAVIEAKPKLEIKVVVGRKLDSTQVATIAAHAQGWQDCWDYYKSLAIPGTPQPEGLKYLLSEEQEKEGSQEQKPKNKS